MKDYIIKEEQLDNDTVIQVYYDEHPYDPIETLDIFEIINFHDRYKLGTINTTKDKFNDEITRMKNWEDENWYAATWADVQQALGEHYDAIHIRPLMLHDHSGISIYIGTSGDRWDSSRIGYIYTTKNKVAEFGLDSELIDEQIDRFIKEYDQYLRGEVYAYNVVKYTTCNLGERHTEVLESCSGFLSTDEAIEHAKEAITV